MDLKNIDHVIVNAYNHPYRTYTMIIEGFRFLIWYDEDDAWLAATMSFAPDWSHTSHCYGDDAASFKQSIIEHIEEAKQIFSNGGLFPADYPCNT